MKDFEQMQAILIVSPLVRQFWGEQNGEKQ